MSHSGLRPNDSTARARRMRFFFFYFDYHVCYIGRMNTRVAGNTIYTSPEETAVAAELWLKHLQPSTTGATVVGLHGNLGSGKTTFVQAVARALGVMEQVTSPTFVIQKSYPVVTNSYSTGFTQLIHIDAYRIDDPKELEILGFPALCSDPHRLILIEWPERIASLLPADTRELFFTFKDETTREIRGL